MFPSGQLSFPQLLSSISPSRCQRIACDLNGILCTGNKDTDVEPRRILHEDHYLTVLDIFSRAIHQCKSVLSI
jgi:hypothetical protein